ncbi:hypothetical protein LTS15_003209 [Exophiala xenobiotica]|nr:hypothetical protein LTS15_003209 [Exophiala xenobiotica]
MDTIPASGAIVAREKASLENVLVIATLMVGTVSASMTNGIISTTLGQPSFLEYFGFLTANGTSVGRIGVVNGVFFTGSLFGLYYQAYICDRFGRKMSLANAAVFTIIGGAMLAGSVHIAMLIVFRFVAGFGASQFVGTVPIMMSEMSPPHHRGLFVGMFSVAISAGYTLSSVLGVGFYFVSGGGAQWRVPFALCTVLSVVTLALLPWIPESPRWLVMQDRTDEAARIIRRLHGSRKDMASDHFASLEIEQIKAQVLFERRNHVTWWEFLTSKKYFRRATVAALGFALSQVGHRLSPPVTYETYPTFLSEQSCGILVINSYGAAISKGLGFSSIAQLSITLGYNASALVSVSICSTLVDRVGRVRFITIGVISLVSIMAIFTALVKLYAGGPNISANAAAVAMIILFTMVYGGCVEGEVYTYASEIFPSHLRAKGITWGISWLYLVIIPFTTGALYAFETIGWRFYLVFIIVPLFLLAAFVYLARETKGKTLEEIGALFGDEMATKTLDEQIQEEKLGMKAAIHAESKDQIHGIVPK